MIIKNQHFDRDKNNNRIVLENPNVLNVTLRIYIYIYFLIKFRRNLRDKTSSIMIKKRDDRSFFFPGSSKSPIINRRLYFRAIKWFVSFSRGSTSANLKPVSITRVFALVVRTHAHRPPFITRFYTRYNINHAWAAWIFTLAQWHLPAPPFLSSFFRLLSLPLPPPANPPTLSTIVRICM